MRRQWQNEGGHKKRIQKFENFLVINSDKDTHAYIYTRRIAGEEMGRCGRKVEVSIETGR